jgi:hypothetical protein
LALMLTEADRAELKRFGTENVRTKLQSWSGSRSSALTDFLGSSVNVTRGDVEDWLAEQAVAEAAQQRETLNWAKIAGKTAIGAVILAAISVILAAFQLWISWPSAHR